MRAKRVFAICPMIRFNKARALELLPEVEMRRTGFSARGDESNLRPNPQARILNAHPERHIVGQSQEELYAFLQAAAGPNAECPPREAYR